jgi:predicted ATPase
MREIDAVIIGSKLSCYDTVNDSVAVPAAVAAALGVQVGNGDALAGLCEAMKALRMLVALDNAEQVLDGVARLTSVLLQTAPGVRLVVAVAARSARRGRRAAQR